MVMVDGRWNSKDAMIISSKEVEDEWREFFEHDSPSQNDQPVLNFRSNPPPTQPPRPRSHQPSSLIPPSSSNYDHIINCTQNYNEKLCVAYYNAYGLFDRFKEKLQPITLPIKENAIYVYDKAFEIRWIRDFVVYFVASVVFFVIVLIVGFCLAPRYDKDSYRILVLKDGKRLNKV